MTESSSKTSADIRGLAPLLNVFDIQNTLTFYCDILGFSVVATSDPGPRYGWVLLSLNRTEIMFEPIYPVDQQPVTPDPLRMAHHRDTVIYFGCANIDDLYQHLRSKNIAADAPRIAYYGMKQLYVNDPDGYLLCFQWPESKEQIAAWKDRYGKH